MEEEESEEEEDELPMYQEHYDALFSMDFVETKYPHDDTMKALGIFEMWSWSSRTCTWPSSSLTAWSLQGAHFSIRSPVLRYVHKALPTPSLQGRRLGQSNEGEVKLLDMGIKPIISRTRMGRRSGEIESMQGTSCLSLTSYSPTRPPPIALGFKQEERESNGKDDWTSPKVQQVARESHGKDAKVHGQDGEQDQNLEKKVSGSSSKKKKSKAPTSLGVGHSSPLKGGSLPKSLTEPLLSSQGKEKTTRREGGRLPRPDAPARPPDSIESKQRKLNSIELTVELTRRSPSSRIRDLNTIPCLTRSLPGVDGTPMDSTSYQCSTKAKEATHISTMKKRRKRSHKLDRVSRKRQPSCMERS
ncbi:unnamed protein product [Microthlaspi erraticum]|uniref:Uncharacterized protein n=1 Tax=Microthlaspi erraticum TaxID=1685480 RepID=A0A6D2HNH2_9BRAS|nr:unnamed protein product [Microthlaspi erraticum]